MATAWDKLEQLLTCAICLDRFRNPKMLPCQHSFCQEPCMEGLQDYARRQIKCPECRAEHRIPFQGIQTYPTNVTLQRFLELHQSITGEEPEPVPSMMERCGVCSEKSTVTKCSHCDKKVCPECKEAHIDILKREISRICHQVRRALNRLQDALSQTERSMERLNVNSVHIRDEIEEIVRRFVKDLKAQEDKMLKDLETYSQVESKNLAKLKDDLAIEYDFLKDNCDSVEKNIVDPEKNWNDVELCEVKYIFVKTLDFLRNFDADAADYTRGMKFLPSSELDTLRRNLVNFGELKLLTSEEANANVRASSPGLTSGSNSLSVPQQSMLMRSQSDHRLATQFARRDSRISDLTSQSRLNPGYSDSEKDPRDSNRATSPSNYSRSRRDDSSRLGRYGVSGVDDGRDSTSRNRFLREADNYRSAWSRTDDDSFTSGPQFKSRFMRERGAELSGFDEFEYDPNAYLSRSVRFEEPTTTVPSSVPAPLVKVFDVPEAPRGCLSGIVKISDTAHYMERSHENEVRAKVEKERKEEESRSLPPPSSIPAYQSPQRPRPPSRQVSEDEIEKQKKMNQASAASSVTTNTNSSSLTNSNTTTPSTIGLTSTTTPVNSYGSSITASNTPSSDSIRPITRRIGTFRDDEDNRSSSTLRSTSDNNTSSTRRSDTNDLTSSLVDDNDDDLGESNLSRLGRRRRGSLSGEDSKESVTSSGRSSQVTATPASSASTATSGLRSVRAPLAKNLPIAEEEEDRDRDIARKRGPKSSLVNPTASSLGSSTIAKQTDNRNKDDDLIQSMPKFEVAHGGNDWPVEEVVWDDLDEEEEEEEEAEEDEEDGEEGEEEEEEIVEDEQEENEEDEEDAEEEGEEEEDDGNGNISREGARPSTPEPFILDNYGAGAANYTGRGRLRHYLKIAEMRINSKLRNQDQKNATLTQSEQFDKGRENGLPCSVADLLDRSAQVRRDSVELRHRFFEVDRPSSSHEHKPGNTRASRSSQMSGLSDQQSQNQSERPGTSTSNLEDSPTSQFDRIYRPRYPLGLSEGGLDSSPRTGKLNRHSANTVNDKHETPSWSRSKPNNRLSSHARSSINPLTVTSGFDNHNLSTTTVTSPKPLKKSSDRSYYHSPNYHSNPVTGRIISPALTSVNSGPLAASSASASTAASNALSSSSHNYDLSNSRLSRSKSSHLLGGW